jgi:hypothetical protein
VLKWVVLLLLTSHPSILLPLCWFLRTFSHGEPPSNLWCFIWGSQFYSMGNPLHGVPSSGGNIYPHMSNPCHVTFSSQAASSVMMPLQPFMNQLGGGYYPTGKGHGVYQNPAWPTSLKTSLSRDHGLRCRNQSTASHVGSTSPVTASHTGIKSPTSASHVGDLSPTSASHVGDLKPTSASHVGDLSPASASHVGGKNQSLQVMLGAQL